MSLDKWHTAIWSIFSIFCVHTGITHTQPLPIILVKSTMVQSTAANNIHITAAFLLFMFFYCWPTTSLDHYLGESYVLNTNSDMSSYLQCTSVQSWVRVGFFQFKSSRKSAFLISSQVTSQMHH